MPPPASHSNSCPPPPRAPGRKQLLVKAPAAPADFPKGTHPFYCNPFLLCVAAGTHQKQDQGHHTPVQETFPPLLQDQQVKGNRKPERETSCQLETLRAPLLPLQKQRTTTSLASASTPHSSHPAQVLLILMPGNLPNLSSSRAKEPAAMILG